jgi:hypothetical protein
MLITGMPRWWCGCRSWLQDRRGLAQTDAVAFSGPGVEAMENFFEGDDDDVLVKCAIHRIRKPRSLSLIPWMDARR